MEMQKINKYWLKNLKNQTLYQTQIYQMENNQQKIKKKFNMKKILIKILKQIKISKLIRYKIDNSKNSINLK